MPINEQGESRAEKGDSIQIGNFNDVDATKKADQFVSFLAWIEGLPQAVRLRERTYELLALESGDRVIDAGCGTGRVVAELQARGMKATGVDISAHMISVARSRFPESDFLIVSAESLPFEDGSVNGYRAERVFQHLKDPARVLAEARRVLAPGGRIVLADQDYDMWAIDADDEAVTRTLMRSQSDAILNRWIGRRYYNLLQEAGFIDVVVEVQTLVYTEYAQVAPVLPGIANPGVEAGAITREQADDWLTEQERRGREGRFFLAMPLFLASGRQP